MSNRSIPLASALMLATALVTLAAEPRPAEAAAADDRWAVVNQNGTLARGKGAVSSAYAVPGMLGDYKVVFNKNVSKCMYVATLGTEYPSTPASGEIAVAPDVANAKAVRVFTRTSGGIPTNKPFHLFVSC